MCNEEIRAAIAACGPTDPPSCVWNAAPLHSGPIMTVDTLLYGPLRVSCGGEGGATPDVWPCYGWQATSCDAEFCPDELTTWSDCVYAGGTCTEERDALRSCTEGSADHQACVTERIRAC
jgi:hypothetical protein